MSAICPECSGDGMYQCYESLPRLSGEPGERTVITWITCERCDGEGVLTLTPLDTDDEE